jgi:hypothetical protein
MGVAYINTKVMKDEYHTIVVLTDNPMMNIEKRRGKGRSGG